MGVTASELSEYYPRLYHMAEGGSWESIQRHGLLSTEALVDLFEIPSADRDAILTHQRTKCITIRHPQYGEAVIRDQKPLNRAKLESCLQDCSFEEWLQMLNSRVFFWLTKERLQTLMCAREYCGRPHVVLVLDTRRVAEDHADKLTLAPMNTGSTQPFAHPRGLSTFRRMADYPFEKRLPRGPYYRAVELAVPAGVGNITDYVTEVAEMQCSGCDKDRKQEIVLRKVLYP